MTQDSSDLFATILAQGISKYYGDFAALHDLSFSIGSGRVVAFLGPNGAGKSTTMKILTGFSAPSGGRVRVLGLDPQDPHERVELARHLGYLPESGPLYEDMTPAEMLAFCASIRQLDHKQAAVDQSVERCQLGEVLHKPIHKLSKGFRQRVGMAQALLGDPDVLILDEPTSGLDPIQIAEVRSLIRQLARSKTVLLSTHILQEVEAVADDVVMIAHGRLVFDGSLPDFKARGPLQDTFEELVRGGADRKEAA